MYFGMKAPIGVNVASRVTHAVVGTAANEADINQTGALLHGHEIAVFADAGYTVADKRPEHCDREVSWNIAVKRQLREARSITDETGGFARHGRPRGCFTGRSRRWRGKSAHLEQTG